MKTKKWTKVGETPGGGTKYHKEGVNDIMIVYYNIVKLFKNIDTSDEKGFWPVHSEYTLYRKGNFRNMQ